MKEKQLRTRAFAIEERCRPSLAKLTNSLRQLFGESVEVRKEKHALDEMTRGKGT